MVKRIGMRRLAAFAAAAALVLGLVGCGGAQSTAQGNTEPVNLSVWTYYNGDQLESFNQLVETVQQSTVGKEKNITGRELQPGQRQRPRDAACWPPHEGKVGASAQLPNIVSWPTRTPPMRMDQMGRAG